MFVYQTNLLFREFRYCLLHVNINLINFRVLLCDRQRCDVFTDKRLTHSTGVINLAGGEGNLAETEGSPNPIVDVSYKLLLLYDNLILSWQLIKYYILKNILIDMTFE